MILYDNTGVTVELGDIVKAGTDIWAFEYPSFYTGADKLEFEQKVIDHYRFRQIGQETVGRWLHMFRTRIREIMPYYIRLYKSVELMDNLEDPFGNVDITETFEQISDGKTETSAESDHSTATTGTGSSQGKNGLERRFSNTPQGSIENLDNYLTEATIDDVHTSESTETTGTDKGTATSRSAGQTSGNVRHTLTRKGNQGVNTYAHDMKELRETFLNVDMLIIRDLNDLFLGVY